MAKQATYEIVINGVKESIAAVDSLNKQLDALEQRMDKLASKNINVSTSGGDGGARVSALDEEAKMLQQIEQLHQKVAASEKQEYQELLHAKEELKEYQTIAKSIAAQDNLKSGINDLNTMQGMKAQLHDLKAAMQTVDINGDQFRQWAAEANELTQKLKEAEASYGTFSRNVGNYSNGVADGMKKFSLEVGGVTKEFESARKALKELKTELQTLQFKEDQGIISDDEVKRMESLIPVVKQLESSIQDAGKPLDAMLDTMQSLVAIASVGQGLSALFGIDNSEIEKSIQKLVALQNVLQGLQTIQNQINTGEGLIGWFQKGNKAIDGFAAKLVKVEKGASSAANKVTLLAGAMKTFVAAIAVAAIAAFTIYMDKLKKKLDGIKETAKENADVVKTGAEAYATAKLELQGYINKIETFNGNAKQEKKLVDELNSKFGNSIGQYKTLAEWKQALIDKSPAFLQMLKNEALAMANLRNYADKMAEATAKEAEAEELINKVYGDHGQGGVGRNSVAGKQLLDDAKELQEAAKKARAAADNYETAFDKIHAENEQLKKDNGLGTYSNQLEKDAKSVKSNGKKIENAVRDAENNINDLKIKLMKDGLAKELRQLEEQNRQEVNKIMQNGKKVREQLLLQEEYFQQERQKLYKKYADQINSELDNVHISRIQNDIEKLNNLIEENQLSKQGYKAPVSQKEYGELIFGLDYDTINELTNYVEAKSAEGKEALEEYRMYIKDFLATNPELDATFSKMLDFASTPGEEKQAWDWAEAQLEQHYERELNIIRSYGNLQNEYYENEQLKENDLLKTSLILRMQILDAYNEEIIEKNIDYYKTQEYIQKEALKAQKQIELDAAEKEMKDNTIPAYGGVISEKDFEHDERVYELYNQKISEIAERYANEEAKIELNKINAISKARAEYYNENLIAFSDFQAKMSEIEDRQPVLFKSGFINVSETRKNFDEVVKAAEKMLERIKEIRAKVASDNSLLPEERNAINRQLDDQERVIYGSIESAKNGMEGAKEKFRKQIMEIAEQVSQTAQQMISVFGDLYNYNIQKEMDALEDMNQKLEDKLNEQKEIEERHKNEIESIEDELANSRGDRRQQLIDQLNAEMQARREAAAEEKRIEAEKQANERRLDVLDKKKRMAQWRRDIASALISGAMAAANGYATKPFLPTGLAMGALATILTAAQVAIIKHNKPYAKGGQLDGGVIKGKRHYAGGISVLGGRANVEGGEYITNRISTANNVALLDFVNSKKHKINLSELIDFYQSPKALKSSSKRVFADGGQLPTMPNIDLGDIMTDVAIVRDDRPVVVSVVDINRKQDDVRRVRTLAGL